MEAAKRALRAIYPYLTAATPIVFLTVRNVTQVTPDQVVVPMLGILLATAALLFGARKLFGPGRARILVAVLLIVVFTGGSLHESLTLRLGMAWHWPVFAFALLLAAAVVWGVARLTSNNPAREEAATTILSIMALVLFLNMSVRLLMPDKRGVFLDPNRVELNHRPAEHPVLEQESAQTPDIYYIIADAYARQDVLQEFYGYDNSEFIGWLESRGFYVARESWANYPMTFLSLSSSLNMRFINDVAAEVVERARGADQFDRTPFYHMIQRAEVAERLQQKGYRYAQVLTHWGGTDRSAAADLRYKFAPFLGGEFGSTLANMTLLRAFSPTVDHLHHFVADSAPQIAEVKGPTFAFLHLLLPHNPYVFDHEGKVIASYPLTISLKTQENAWRLREPYVEQLRYTNTLLRGMIEGILAKSTTPPIIILQGDHGSSLSMFAEGEKNTAPLARERLGILNAYLVPEAMKAKLYPGITPVNSFRLLLSTQFGDDLPPLPDTSYFAYYLDPYKFRDVTAELHGALPVTHAVTPVSSTSGR